MENSKFLLGALLFWAGTSFAQTSSFSLEEAKNYALENHISVLNADQDVIAAEYQRRETVAMGLPQINAQGSFSNFLNLPVQVLDASFFGGQPGELISFRAGTDYSSSFNFNVNQLVFSGSYIVGLKLSKHYAGMKANAATLTKEEVMYNLVQAYELAAVSKENLVFMDSMVMITQELIDKQENYLELGLMLQEDMDQLNYSLLTAKQSKTQAEVQYQNALELLKFCMGYPMNQEIEITATPSDLMSTPGKTGGDVTTNLTYQVMSDNVTLQEYVVQNDQSAYLPTLNAYMQHGFNAFRNEFDFFDSSQNWFTQTSWGLQLNIPILSSGQRYYKTAQSKVALLKAQNELDQMEQTLTMQSLQANNNLESARSNYELQQENVKLARSIYENELAKEQIGKGNSILVTQKYNQLVVAQAQLVGSTLELLQAQLELNKIYNNLLPNGQQ
ncbi:MAG: TolC family protein [Fluviicola sp.]